MNSPSLPRTVLATLLAAVLASLSGCQQQDKESPDPYGWQRVESEVLNVQFRYPSALIELKRERTGSEHQFLAVSRNQPIELGKEKGPIPPVRFWFVMRKLSGFADRFNSDSREAMTIVAGIRNRRYSQGDMKLQTSTLSRLRKPRPRIWSPRLQVSVPPDALPFHYPDGLTDLNRGEQLDLTVQFYYLFLGEDLIEIEFISPSDLSKKKRILSLLEQTVKSIERPGGERAGSAQDGEKEAVPTVNKVAGADPVQPPPTAGGGPGDSGSGSGGAGEEGDDGGSGWREQRDPGSGR